MVIRKLIGLIQQRQEKMNFLESENMAWMLIRKNYKDDGRQIWFRQIAEQIYAKQPNASAIMLQSL